MIRKEVHVFCCFEIFLKSYQSILIPRVPIKNSTDKNNSFYYEAWIKLPRSKVYPWIPLPEINRSIESSSFISN